MAELEMTETTEPTEKREQSLLNLVCYIGAGLFLALVAYNLFAAGSVISTDGLFFTVVPLFLALCFLVVPGMDMLAKRKAAKALEASGETAEGAAHMESVHAEPVEEVHFAGSNRLFLSVWFWLLLLTGFEVFLGYVQLPVVYMLVILMGASIIKAALIVAYFMHLRFERINLILTIVPAVVICICLFMVFFPDSFRAKNLRYSGPPPASSGSEPQP
ncbi:MAG TPA: cytochrome C oxidase subunit IV family protein [Pyrinomonadaceae bacterium]|nr:cytochrome C oxidase subunit IV family protein [Pyrinomonadaceae bacterium]